jgi:hypothetical protein
MDVVGRDHGHEAEERGVVLILSIRVLAFHEGIGIS